jgi:nitrous oxidase accessory protein
VKTLIVLMAMVCAARAALLQPQIDAAAPGATIELPTGLYDGPVVITKPLTLKASGEATIRGDGKNHVIHIKAANVTIQGFTITRSGIELGKDHAAVMIEGEHATVRGNAITDSLHGIYVKKANDCVLVGNSIVGKTSLAADQGPIDPTGRPSGGELCDIGLDQNRRGNGIHLWNSERISVFDNTIRDVRDGIYFSFANGCLIRGNDISHVRFGLHYMYSDSNVFERNRFAENSAGSTLMFSRNLVVRGNSFAANVGHRAYGMVLTQADNSRVEGNDFSGNTVGLCVEYSNLNTFVGNTFARSYIGARLTGGSDGNRFTRNTFAANLHPVEIDGDFSNNAWTDGKAGNRWGNSAEIDFDGDGIGDLPHREADLLGGLRRPFPLAALLSGSPALDLVHFAQQHARIPGVQAIIDPRPLARSNRPDASSPRKGFFSRLFEK